MVANFTPVEVWFWKLYKIIESITTLFACKLILWFVFQHMIRINRMDIPISIYQITIPLQHILDTLFCMIKVFGKKKSWFTKEVLSLELIFPNKHTCLTGLHSVIMIGQIILLQQGGLATRNVFFVNTCILSTKLKIQSWNT